MNRQLHELEKYTSCLQLQITITEPIENANCDKVSLHIEVVVTREVSVQYKLLGPMRYGVKQYVLQHNAIHSHAAN